MAATKKRRVTKSPPHQAAKRADSGKKINWTRILVITIGILIALSMILSMVVTPGTALQ